MRGFHYKGLAIGAAVLALIGCSNPAASGGAPSGGGSASWQVVGSANISNQEVDGATIAVQGTTPYIAFRGHSQYKPSVYRLASGSWSLVGAADFSAATASDFNLGLGFDQAGHPVLATKGGTQTNQNDNYRPTLFGFGGTSWTSGSLVSPAGETEYARFGAFSEDGEINGSPVVTRANGDVLVAYAVERGGSAEDYHIKVRKLSDGQWSTVFLSSAAGHEPSMVLLNDTPYLAYRDEGQSHKASVYRIDPTGSNLQGTVAGSEGFSTGEGHYPTIRASGSTLYVALRDHSDYKAHVWTLDTSAGSPAWAELGDLASLQSNPIRPNGISMDVSSTGTVALVVQNDGGANDYRCTVYRTTGTAWSVAGANPIYAGASHRPRIALAGEIPYVVFNDEGSSWGATVVALK